MFSPGTNGNGFSWIQKTRNVFHVPLRRLAAHSPQGRGTGLVPSGEKDVEKNPLESCGPFELQYHLFLSNEANKAAGIQPKHVGVTWEDLHVVVHEDKDCKVNSFLWKLGRSSHRSIRHTSRHLTVGSFVCSWAT